MKNKLIKLTLIVATILLLVSCPDTKGIEKNIFKFENNKDGLTIVGINSDSKQGINISKLVIPSKNKNVNITAIADNAFKNNKYITSLEFEANSNIQTIGKSAFENCENLVGSLEIPNSVIYLGESAFENTGLNDGIKISDKLNVLEKNVFKNTSFKKVYIPKSVKEIKEGALSGKFKDAIGLYEADNSNNIVGNKNNGIRQKKFGQNVKTFEIYKITTVKHIYSKPSDFIIENDELCGFKKLSLNEGITDLRIPAHIKKIKTGAFVDNKFLRSIEFAKEESKLQIIEEGAFKNCTNLGGTLELPSGIVTIDSKAFENVNFAQIIIPNSINTFYSDSIITLGDKKPSVLSKKPKSTDTEKWFKLFGSVTYDNGNAIINKTQPFIVDAKGIITGIKPGHENDKKFKVYDVVDGKTIVGIDANGFLFKNRTSAEPIENFEFSANSKVRFIKKDTFKGITLKNSLFLPDSLEEIGESAFEGVKFENSKCQLTLSVLLEKIGKNAFKGVKLNSGFPQCLNLKSIGEGAFAETTLNGALSLNLKKGGKEAFLGKDAFKGSNIPELIISGEYTKTIGESAFENCKELNKITLSGYVTKIGKNAFKGCSNLTEKLDLVPLNEMTIEDGAFEGCKFKRLYISPMVIKFGENSLNLVKNQNQIWFKISSVNDFIESRLPSQVKYDFNTNYHGTFPESQISWNKTIDGSDNMFAYGFNADGTYKITGFNKNYKGSKAKIVIPDTFGKAQYMVTEISEGAFKDNDEIIDVNFSVASNLKVIRESAFENCTNLNVLDLSSNNNLTEIGKNAFLNCNSISGTVSFNDSLTRISDSAFKNCTSIEQISSLKNITALGKSVFEGCENLGGTIEFGNNKNFTSIYSNSFKGCVNIETLILSDSIKSIYTSAFEDTKKLTNVKYGKNLESIGERAFKNSAAPIKLKNTNCKEIKTEAFKGSLSNTIEIPKVIESIGVGAFSYMKNIDGSLFDYKMDFREYSNWKIISEKTFEETILNGIKFFTPKTAPELTIIEKDAFRNTALRCIFIAEDVNSVGEYALYTNNIEDTLKNFDKIIKKIEASDPTNTNEDIQKELKKVKEDLNAFSNWANDPKIKDILDNAPKTIVDCELRKSQIIDSQVTTYSTDTENSNPNWYSWKTCKVNYVRDYLGNCKQYNYSANSDGTYSVVNLKDEYKDIKIIEVPNHYYEDGVVEAKKITKVLDNAFNENKEAKLVDFTAPSYITELGEKSFSNFNKSFKCTALPDTITKIGNSVFENSDITMINIKITDGKETEELVDFVVPKSIKIIPQKAFLNATVAKHLLISSELTEIKDSAFEKCNVSHIRNIDNTEGRILDFGNNIKSIGENAFFGTKGFNTLDCSIKFGDTNTVLTYIGKAAFRDVGITETLILPNSLEHITDNCFMGTKLKKIVLPNKLKTVGNESFAYIDTNANEMTTEFHYLETIGYRAFANMGAVGSNAKKIDFGTNNKLISIGNEAFMSNYLIKEDLLLPATVEEIGESAFKGCSKLNGSLRLPDNDKYTIVEGGVFSGCSFKDTLTIPEHIKVIKAYAFCRNNFTTLNFLGDGIETIEDSVFEENKLKGNIILPKKLKNVGNSSFRNNPEIETIDKDFYEFDSIGKSAFAGCKKLTTLNPIIDLSKLDIINDNIFAGCESLEGKLRFKSDLSEIGEGAFYETKVTLETNFPLTLKKIKSSAFYGCKNITNINIPDGTEEIYSSVFEGCENLVGNNKDGKVVIPNSVKIIGNSAFRNCSSITEINIPEGVTEIQGSAFAGCSKLDFDDASKLNGNIYFRKNLKVLGDSAFAYCTSLKNGIDLSKITNITKLSNSIFTGCKSITGELKLHDKITIIGSNVFSHTNLTNRLNIPESVVAIGANTFANTKFTGLTLKHKLSIIGSGAFDGCEDMQLFNNDDPNIAGGILDFSNLNNLVIDDNYNTSYKYYIGHIDHNIPSSLFRNCKKINPDELKLADYFKTFDSNAFENCENLAIELYIPKNLNSVGIKAFSNTKLENKNIIFPGTLTDLYEDAFENCFVFAHHIYLPRGVHTHNNPYWRRPVFTTSKNNCKIHLEIVKMEENSYFDFPFEEGYTVEYSSMPFEDTNTHDITWKKSNFNDAFIFDEKTNTITGLNSSYPQYSTLRANLIIPAQINGKDVLHLDPNFLTNKDYLKTIFFDPNLKMKEIKKETFANCYYINGNITFPKSLKIIEEKAFIKMGYYAGTNVSIDFGNVEYIGNRAFYNNQGTISKIYSLNSIKEIGEKAFYGQPLDCDLIFGDNLKSIGDNAFFSTGITKLVLGKNVEKIGYQCFMMCENLRSFNLSQLEKLKIIETNVFCECTSLDEDIGLESNNILQIPSCVEEIKEQSFYKTAFLKFVSVQSGVKKLNNYAFSYIRFKKIYLPKSLQEVKSYAINNNSRCQTIYCESTEDEIKNWSSNWNYRNSYSIIVSGTNYSGSPSVFTGYSAPPDFRKK